jgi:uncharacterized protein with PQ loop repeat
MLGSIAGVRAALFSSLSGISQVRKAWSGQPTDDLSLHMLMALTAGLSLRVAYGILEADWEASQATFSPANYVDRIDRRGLLHA